MSLHPTDGVRVLLELSGVEPGGGARYRGAVLTPSARADFDVRIDASAAVTSTPIAGDPAVSAVPDRAADLLRAIARTVGKHAVADEPPRWPRRVLRWRKL